MSCCVPYDPTLAAACWRWEKTVRGLGKDSVPVAWSHPGCPWAASASVASALALLSLRALNADSGRDSLRSAPSRRAAYRDGLFRFAGCWYDGRPSATSASLLVPLTAPGSRFPTDSYVSGSLQAMKAWPWTSRSATDHSPCRMPCRRPTRRSRRAPWLHPESHARRQRNALPWKTPPCRPVSGRSDPGQSGAGVAQALFLVGSTRGSGRRAVLRPRPPGLARVRAGPRSVDRCRPDPGVRRTTRFRVPAFPSCRGPDGKGPPPAGGVDLGTLGSEEALWAKLAVLPTAGSWATAIRPEQRNLVAACLSEEGESYLARLDPGERRSALRGLREVAQRLADPLEQDTRRVRRVLLRRWVRVGLALLAPFMIGAIVWAVMPSPPNLALHRRVIPRPWIPCLVETRSCWWMETARTWAFTRPATRIRV